PVAARPVVRARLRRVERLSRSDAAVPGEPGAVVAHADAGPARGAHGGAAGSDPRRIGVARDERRVAHRRAVAGPIAASRAAGSGLRVAEGRPTRLDAVTPRVLSIGERLLVPAVAAEVAGRAAGRRPGTEAELLVEALRLDHLRGRLEVAGQ